MAAILSFSFELKDSFFEIARILEPHELLDGTATERAARAVLSDLICMVADCVIGR